MLSLHRRHHCVEITQRSMKWARVGPPDWARLQTASRPFPQRSFLAWSIAGLLTGLPPGVVLLIGQSGAVAVAVVRFLIQVK